MMEVKIRKGSIDDLETLLVHRMGMWNEIYPDRPTEVEKSRAPTKKWLRSKLESGEMLSFIACQGSTVYGSGCVLIKEDQVRPGSDSTICPYLLSVFTVPEFRKIGVASLITQEAIKWAKENGYDRMELHASPMGRKIYEDMGFKATNEMRMWF